MNIRDLEIPIIQAPIEASIELAATVSGTGAIGSFQGTWVKPNIAAGIVDGVSSKTKNPFIVNFVLSFEPYAFDAVIEAGAPAVTFSWGHAPELIDRAHRNNVAAGVQIGTARGAKIALSQGADFLICQGVEAGGHVQSTIALETLLPQVLSISGDVPVFAAGGLAAGNDIAWALSLGATGVMLGTRFVATKESEAHQQYKEFIVASSGADSVYTLCFDGGWSLVAHRVLRNATLNMWEDAGCPIVGKRPGEGDIVARGKSQNQIKRYDHYTPMQSITDGDANEWCLYAGTSCEGVKDIPSASELIHRLWTDCQDEYSAL